MPAFLLIDARDQDIPDFLGGLLAKHGASIGKDDSSLAFFDLSPKAIGCALEFQERLVESNRANKTAKPSRPRMCIHVTSDSAGTATASEPDLKAASLVLESAPPGRVFLSRQAYSQAQGARVCAFISLGLEYFNGLAEPLEFYEAIQLAGQPRGLAALGTLAPLTAAAPTQLKARPPEQSALPAQPVAFTPLMLAAIAAVACVFFGAKRGLNTLLSPIDIANSVFHLAGNVIFGLTGSESLSLLGGPLVQLAMPLAVAAHFRFEGRPLGENISLLWLGQNLFSLGGPLAMGILGPGPYCDATRTEMLSLADMLGLAGHAYGFGQVLVFLGCLIMSFAVVPMAWRHFDRAP